MLRITHVIVILVFMSLSLPGCSLLGFYEWDWNQKITVEVKSRNGLISGFSIMKVRCEVMPKWLFASYGGMGCKLVQAEAVTVEISPGRVLVVPLKNPSGSRKQEASLNYIALDTYVPNWHKMTDKERRDGLLKSLPLRWPFPKKKLPAFITFRHINDPATVKRVDPQNLVAGVGGGGRLKRITIELTTEPVTTGKVEEIFTWLCPLLLEQRIALDGRSMHRHKTKLANHIDGSYFKTEKCGSGVKS